MPPVNNQLYKYDVGGKPSYQVMPEYNVAGVFSKVDPSEYGKVDPSLVSQVGKPSNYSLENGVFKMNSSLDSAQTPGQLAQNQAVMGARQAGTAIDPSLLTEGKSPTLANGQQPGGLNMPAPTSLQIPTGTGANTVFDPTTGQQITPAQAAFNAKKASGVKPPQESGAASGIVAGAITSMTPPTPPDTSGIDAQLAADPGYQQLLADRLEYANTINQGKSLLDTYNQLTKDSGLPAINAELLNTKRIIEGTEDDIRQEVQAVSGFATDSQVMALAGARNKQLIKNYNSLLDAKAMAQESVNTMVGLAAKDRDFALSSITQKMKIDEQLSTYRDKFVNNAKEAYNNVIKAVGYGGLYQSLANSGDPSAVSLAEKNLGLAPGELKQLATYVKPEDALDTELKKAQIANIKSEIANRGSSNNSQSIVDTGNGKVLLTYDKKGNILNQTPIGTGMTPETQIQQQAQSKSNIDLIGGLLQDKNLSNVVGPNSLSRGFLSQLGTGGLLNNFGQTGKSDFIAGVQQLTSQLTLDSLVRAKANGATFGALSEGELNLLSGSASKLNTWAHKDSSGNVQYYDTSEGSFKKELDKIKNFAALDYVLKGGNPQDVGVQTMPDGTHWIINSDGSKTQL